MIGAKTKHGYIDFAELHFNCPHCKKQYSSAKYEKRCEVNKSQCTKIKCICGNKFSITYCQNKIVIF